MYISSQVAKLIEENLWTPNIEIKKDLETEFHKKFGIH